jgi:uncharacterized protein
MEQRKDFLGVGWANPVALDPQTGSIALVRYETDINQAIRIIIETAKGERVMRPDFGCGIHDLVFTALSSTIVQRIKTEIEDALRKFEPRIEVLDVNVFEDELIRGHLKIELEYRVRRTNAVGNLVFPFMFKEGGVP